MKIIQNINNNFAIAIDDFNNQVILTGKGIGFGKCPREVTDFSKIERSFYDVNEDYITTINDIPLEIIEISSDIIEKARLLLDLPISSNLVFTLADHINFSIKRFKNNIKVKLPILHDIELLFEKEYEVGLFALDILKRRLKIYLPIEEAAYIALHIINAEEYQSKKTQINNLVIEEITKIIEKAYNIQICRDNFNYSRFTSHMHYLFKRGISKHLIQSENNQLFLTLKETHKKCYECSEKISEYLKDKLRLDLSDEEKRVLNITY